jgi:hypothetical protein
LPTQAINLSSVVHFEPQYFSSRYEREQRHVRITENTYQVMLAKTDIAAGGVTAGLSFSASSYNVHVSTDPNILGPVGGTYTRVGTERRGSVTITFTNEPDGPIFLTVVPSTTSTECYPKWGCYLDRNGQAGESLYTIFQSYSYDWVSSKYNHVCERVLKTELGNTTKPIVPRAAVPFSTALSYTQISREDRVPNYHVPHRPITTVNGIVGSECSQPYDWAPLIASYPTLPLLDGPRGIGTAGYLTFLRYGRNAKLYFCDPWRFGVIDAAGTVKTLLGFRHSVAPYWDDPQTHHVVGDWDSSIPISARCALECWGQAWHIPTVGLDNGATPIGGEQPHVFIGPVSFFSDRNGFVLKAQFNGGGPAAQSFFGNTDRDAPPKVTRHFAANDPWGLDTDGADTIFVAERGLNRISKWNANTGAFLGVLVSGANLGYMLDRVWKPNVGVTLAQIRAQPCVAPEGLVYQDGYVYWGSLAQKEVRRVNVSTGVVEVVRQIEGMLDGNSKFVFISLSDGTFGPRGTVFVSSWSALTNGRAHGFVPTAGTVGGVAVTHSVWWDWHRYGKGVEQGPGGQWEAMGYATCSTVGHGRIAVGSSNNVVSEYLKREASETNPDMTKMVNGFNHFMSKGYNIVHGEYGHGWINRPLPWGENADMDYWFSKHGHSQGASPDVQPPVAPTDPLTLFSTEWTPSMYTVTLRGNTGSRTDVAKVRFYDGSGGAAVDFTPSVGSNQVFTITFQHPGGPVNGAAASVTVQHSFVDAAGNESAKLSQTLSVPAAPDTVAPVAPDTPLTVVSIVWA